MTDAPGGFMSNDGIAVLEPPRSTSIRWRRTNCSTVKVRKKTQLPALQFNSKSGPNTSVPAERRVPEARKQHSESSIPSPRVILGMAIMG